MSDHWDIYICNVNDKLASIFVDLGLNAAGIDKSRPLLGWVFVEMNSPREDGLSSNEEHSKLIEIEIKLEENITEASGLYCGRVTTDGRREFYFYLAPKPEFENSVRAAMKGFPGYAYKLGIETDADWKQYREFLYPGPEQKLLMANQRVIEQLKNAGDLLDQPRTVDHFCYFPTERLRDEFEAWANRDGFAVTPLEKGGAGFSWGTMIAKTHYVDAEAIGLIAIQLMEGCRRFGGEYDGWGCPVVLPS